MIIIKEYMNCYGYHWIGHEGLQGWLPYSADITPLGFFFWGCMKELVYQKKSHTRNELWQNMLVQHFSLKITKLISS
jgi:hypothetical protein